MIVKELMTGDVSPVAMFILTGSRIQVFPLVAPNFGPFWAFFWARSASGHFTMYILQKMVQEVIQQRRHQQRHQLRGARWRRLVLGSVHSFLRIKRFLKKWPMGKVLLSGSLLSFLRFLGPREPLGTPLSVNAMAVAPMTFWQFC